MTTTEVDPGEEDVAAAPAAAGEDEAQRSATRRSPVLRRLVTAAAAHRVSLSVVALYLALGCLAYWPVPPFSDSHVVYGGTYDVAEAAWFLAWTPHAILHGLNPFFTRAMNYPYGVNLASNTSMPLLGVLGAPITYLFGPFATFNVFMRLAFGLSATSMYLVLQRLGFSRPASFAAGLLYGFSPYLVAQGTLHLNLAFVPFPPLVLLAFHELFVRRSLGPRRAGLLLGGSLTAQYLVSSEVFADIVLVALVGLAALALRFPRRAWALRRRAVEGVAWSLLPFAVLCGFPVAYAVFGAEHVSVASGAIYGNGTFHADLLSPIVPTSLLAIAPTHWARLADGFVNLNQAENGIYLGIPLVALTLAAGVLVRNALARCALVLALVSFAFSLGTRLTIDGTVTSVPLPFALVDHLPLVQIEVPARYSLLTVLFVAVVLAAALDALWRRVGAPAAGPRRRRLGWAACGLLAAACLVPVIPVMPYASPPTKVPSYFLGPAVDAIPQGSVVLAYPYPITPWNYAMAWQAEAHFRFSIIGDYAETPFQPVQVCGGGGGGGIIAPTLCPAFVEILYEAGMRGVPVGNDPAAAPFSAPGLGPSPGAFATTAVFLRKYHVQTLVVDRYGLYAGQIVTFLSAMLHRPGKQLGGVTVWYRVPQLLAASGG